jgi:hypothetical protein
MKGMPRSVKTNYQKEAEMKKSSYLIALLLLAVLIMTPVSCSNGAKENIVAGNGTVEYIELEGGFYGIVADDGKKYDPINLAPEFQQDGLRVRFEARVRKDLASTHMWGTIVEITRIEKLA